MIQMDADFSHPPDQIPTLLHEIETHDVVLGSRYLNGITVLLFIIHVPVTIHFLILLR